MPGRKVMYATVRQARPGDPGYVRPTGRRGWLRTLRRARKPRGWIRKAGRIRKPTGIIPRRIVRMARKPKPKITARGKKGFLMWLKRDLPKVYAALSQKYGGTLGDAEVYTVRQEGMDYATGWDYDTGEYSLSAIDGIWDDVLAIGTKVVEAGIPVWQQKKAIEIQARRARQGMQPLPMGPGTKGGIYMQPGAGVPTAPPTDIARLALPIGIGVAALLVLPKLLKG